MSAALVRRGLELLSADLTDGRDGKKKKQKAMKGDSSQKSSRRPTVGQSRATTKDRRTRSALDEYRRKQQRSQSGVELQYFLQSQSTASDQDTTKIMRQNAGRQSRSGAQRTQKNKKNQEQSVFTEEEFQQFQTEYFGSTVEQQ